MKGIIGRKIAMTQVFSEQGDAIPVTLVEAGPCAVSQIKTLEKEGYTAVQLGFGAVKGGKINQPRKGHFESRKLEPKRHLIEIRVDDASEHQVGQVLTVDIFSKGDHVDVTGRSKGKGFAGVIKRHGFSGGPGSHGAHFHRAPGAIGACATPSKVMKGKRMPGRMGNERVTAMNLEVVDVNPERNLLLLKGSVPGADGGLLIIRESHKIRKKRKQKAQVVI